MMAAYWALVTLGASLGAVALVGYAAGLVVVWRKGKQQ